MTYSHVIQQMYQLRQFGMKLGLDKMFRLASLLGNPQSSLKFIHVAGTNGKGSTCAYLESIYRESGLKTGLFTSPHLVHFGERIQVNRQRLMEQETVALYQRILPHLELFPDDYQPTFFELTTAMALLHFAEQGCEVVIWETGLGGRLDATNIVTPLASVITNIGLDHQAWLGETHALIAGEKAGIIKEGVPVFTATEHAEALKVIQTVAASKHAPLTCVGQREVERWHLDRLPLPLAGPHQRLNAALALSVVDGLTSCFPVAPEHRESGLVKASWPGRFQVLQRPRQTLVLDGAHNAEGALALAQTLAERYPHEQAHFILGTLKDKTWRQMLEAVLPLANRVSVVPVESDRSASPEELLSTCERLAPGIGVTLHPHLSDAIRKAESSPLVVITGSLYLIGQAVEELEPEKAPSLERGLNEWKPGNPG